MLVSSYFLIGRRFCRRFFILTGLFFFALGVYLAVAFLRIYVPANDVATLRQPVCLRPQLDEDLLASAALDQPAVQPLRCHEEEPDWIDPSNGTFHITSVARLLHGDVVCQYIPILRGPDDFQIVHGRPVKPMTDGAPLPSDFFEARCVGSDGAVHVGLYSGIAAEPMVLERCRSILGVESPDNQQALDILIFGFDSVSRTSWMRQLAKSHEFIVNELGAQVFTGYNIVGDGTPQALLPLLTGHTETELPEARRGFDGAQTVDDHPWIWRQLKNVDYVTQWAEDSAEIGTFTYRMLGFQHQPVDHYMRTFYLAAERRYVIYRPYCVGSTPRHVNMFAWQRQFFERYADCRKFSFVFHSEFSHDNSDRLPLADDDLRRHLSALYDNGHLDRTVLVLISDHGPRFGDKRRTTRGKYDERLPYLAVRLPPSFTARHPSASENLRLNAATGRLVTAFDVHATLLDVMRLATTTDTDQKSSDLSSASQDTQLTDDTPPRRPARAISLFDEVPVDRTCADADIAAHWCACLRWQPLTVDSPPVQVASQRVVDVINGVTSSHRGQCAELRLDEVFEADLFADDDRLLQFRRSSDVDGRVPDMTDTLNVTELWYRVVLRTQPGDAVFEATVQRPLGHQSTGPADNVVFDVDTEQISRTNQYDRQPHCIMHTFPHLRPYCYCLLPEPAIVPSNASVVGSNDRLD